MTRHLSFGLDGVHIEGNLLYLKMQWHNRKRRRRKEGRRIKGGEEMLKDVILPSRGLERLPTLLGVIQKRCIQSVTLGVKFRNCSIIIVFTSS